MLLPKIKKLLVVIIASVALLMVTSPAMAADSTTLEDNIFNGYTNKLDDGSKPYYYLDITADPEEDDGGAAGAIKDFFTGKALEDKMVTSFYEMKNMLSNFFFRCDVFLTTALINGLEMAFNHDVIDKLINNKIETFMRGIAGVNSAGGFTSGGLIGSFMPVITAISVLFALYLFIGKRSQMGAFKSIGSTILVLALAAGFFSNYGSFLKGMNQVATGLSQVVLVGPSSVVTNSNKPMNAIKDDLFAEVWEQFVTRPYLYMQYGTDDVSKIGKGRITELLKMKPNQERLEYIQQKEVIDKNNVNMTYTNVDARLVFTGFYSFFNFVNGIPFLILMIALEVTQYWFLAISCLAPFVFAWSAFPNQIGVLKRFGFHLSFPLLAKVLISLATFIYFMISDLVYSINASNMGGYIISGFSMLAILVAFVLLWKPITRIFGESKQFNLIFNEVREFKTAATQHLGTVTRLAGTVVGAAVGGVQGAAVGGAIGSAIGGDDGSSEDVRKTKEPNAKEIAPIGNLPSQEETQTPLQINDWRDNHQEVADLPELEETNEQPQVTEQPTTKPIELVELPPLEEDVEESESVFEEAK